MATHSRILAWEVPAHGITKESDTTLQLKTMPQENLKFPEISQLMYERIRGSRQFDNTPKTLHNVTYNIL